MGIYWFLIVVPSLLVVLVSRWIWPHQITLKEWGLQFGALFLTTLICIMFLTLGKYAHLSDFDILNGIVTSKDSEHVTCEHEYVCGQTCSGSGKHRSCRPKYCKLHAYDVDWHVESTVGQSTIDRVDSRGLTPPPRWLEAKIGELATSEESVTSYLLVDPDRFKTTEAIRAKYKDVELPDYPRVKDYYRFDRIVNETPNDYSTIREYLDNALKNDGVKYQLNVTVLVTNKDDDYFNLINEYWSGVRKNDVVLVYGVDDASKMRWFQAMTYGDGQGNQILLSKLDTLARGQTLDLELVTKQYSEITEDYKRLPAKTFAYLEDSYQPEWWQVLLFVVLNLALSIWVTWYLKENDVV